LAGELASGFVPGFNEPLRTLPMSEQLEITAPEGKVTVPAATLARIVVRAAELADGARVRRPRRGVDVEISGDHAAVTLRLAARYGAVLPQLAEDVQRHVADALGQMCGIEVRSVDVAIEELV
jgi:uncharacterized alkaline shock family protein YloU